MKNILVVDDDAHISDVICFALEKAGHKFMTASDGAEAIEQFNSHPVDLIILDVGLPEIDGLEVCRQIRKQSEVPILFLSARDEEIDRILGLEIGGDDYVTKPFSPRELMARISVILKRSAHQPNSKTPEQSRLQFHSVFLDTDFRTVQYNNTVLDLTALEFEILKTMMARPRMVFTRENILDTAYPDNLHVSDRTIDSHIRNIRGKFKDAGCDAVIDTVHGIGFRLGNCE